MKEGDERLCYYCQRYFQASIIDRVSQMVTTNAEGGSEDVDVYWCGCSQSESVIMPYTTED